MNKNKSGNVEAFFALVIFILFVLVVILKYDSLKENKHGPQKEENVLVGRIVKFGGCEYIEQRTAYDYYIWVHKGNCSNQIHKYNTERVEK